MDTALSPVSADERLDGIVIGVFVGFAEDGSPLVVFSGSIAASAVRARSTAVLDPHSTGCQVALLFENGDPAKPIILGRIVQPQPPGAQVQVTRDGERLELTADREISLKCGKASITLTRAGKVLIRGAYILSRSSGANKIKGSSIDLN